MSNQYIGELTRMLNNRYSVESAGMTTGEWITANTTVRGRPFSFTGYEFQRAICDDLHPELDVIKISQVGLTEIKTRKALAFCVRNPAVTGIFSLPNEAMYRKFSQTRLLPMIVENKAYQPPTEDKPVRSMDVVQLGRSFLHIVNAVEGSATSTPADFVFNDEVDLSDQKILALFGSRLQNSSFKIKQRFSTPTWVGFGIDASYAVTDQREYMCQCHACNHWQVPIFDRRFVYIPGLPDSVDLPDIDDNLAQSLALEDAFVMCEKCGAPLDLASTTREWVKTYPSRTNAHGYRVRAFTTAKIPINYIINELLSYKRRDFIRGWHNTVLGDGYTDSRSRLEEVDIKAVMGSYKVPEISSADQVMFGADIGQTCHIVVGRRTPEGIHVIEFRTCQVSQIHEVLDQLKAKYNLVGGATDRFPYTPTSEAIRDQTEGKVMPVEYRGSEELKPVKNVEGNITHWQADRTKALDNVAKAVRDKRIYFEGYDVQQTIIVSHLRDQIRDENPEKPARWVKLTGVDHYSHALAFLLLGFRMREVEVSISTTDTRDNMFFGGLALQQSKVSLR
jgi:hypothetical protein